MNGTKINFKSAEFIDCFPASHNIYYFIWCIYLFACELCNPITTQYLSNVPVASKYAIIAIRISKMDSDVWFVHCELAYCFPDTAIGYQHFSLCRTTLQIRREKGVGSFVDNREDCV